MNAPDLPDAAITAAAAAIHFWPAGDDATCACLPGHPTARYDNDRNKARLALEAAAPALRAQGAATERALISDLAKRVGATFGIRVGNQLPRPFADLLDGNDG